MSSALMKSSLGSMVPKSGKVRDVYDADEDKLVIVATDRISAFDVVLPTGIPGKGKILTDLSVFWLTSPLKSFTHHFITSDVSQYPPEFRQYAYELEGRSMLVHRAKPFPVECIVRGYLTGSGWIEYQKSQTVCGLELPSGVEQCGELKYPIFTPSTKAEQGGHDENISFDRLIEIVGKDWANALRYTSIALYRKASMFARQRGIIIADTKFEFGISPKGELMLIDEVLTPDSSRFWPLQGYIPGRDQPSFDKQYVRDWLKEFGWNKASPAPLLPPHVVECTYAKYVEAYKRLTDQPHGKA